MGSTYPQAIILGSRADLHVQRVLDAARVDPIVVDVASLTGSEVTLSLDSLTIASGTQSWCLGADALPTRGWVRRLAPENWQAGVVAGTREAAENSAWLSTIAMIGRTPAIEWLTTVDDGLVAENKLHQLVVARSRGVKVPHTAVTNSPASAIEALPAPRIVKAFGRAHYFDKAQARMIFAQTIDDDQVRELGTTTPLMFQEHLVAEAHLRVVTVRGQVWTCRLDADGVPLDWRSLSSAHDGFVEVKTPAAVSSGARAVARGLRLGYSSQDWIVTTSGPHLVDVNPGGQWLFLPEPVASQVAGAIAAWLEGN